ncbi:hypothetical protein BN7_4406 [Wickerhamomyces ciferrii]|uniref:NAD-dependent epimerase/dehydratase domain-containing protein n=1 Tax=Wickerhamomyces ciferrii (strain ATCC 14091 / BCRC 22168 / CBS 111 / JCM 3599 / NBRC 0793 / NRRL Y-1031 F-60-10) TaxID=1206466 RepID=K0KS68_WICCF|nr:uncharacterized protein BN7_4406 [Wickerhamomyces ciferrii]CCH44837.1 hypothetical protein BN7_4406 [Wickerhamomyces ciferrii]
MAGETVFVSGANGFIALHIISRLLNKGYNVIGSVRSQEKADDLYKKFQTDKSDPKFKIVIIEDLIKPGAFDDVLKNNKDIKYVLHTASPFKFGFTDDFDEGYRKPAVEGTINALKAIDKYGENVITTVVTSSFASVMNFDKLEDSSFIHNENVWNPIEWDQVKDQGKAYVASKKLAEKAAWDYVKEHNVKFNLNTVLPVYVFGPQLFDEDASLEKTNTSNQIIINLLKSDPNDTKFFKDTSGIGVDVRDVADFHILAFERGIKNQRLFAASETFTDQKLLNIINEYVPQLTGKIAKGSPSKAYTVNETGFSTQKSRDLLGDFEFISLKDQVVDTVNQALKQNK